MGILDYFIERTDEPAKTDASSSTTNVPKLGANQSTPAFAGTTVNTVSTFAPSPSVTADDMAKFNQHFDELFDQANLPGPDYFEFSKMCQAMASLPEDAKFPAVFTGLQVQGLTKAKLLESANHYIAIIDEDAKKFNSAIDGKLMAEVNAKRQNAANKQKALQDKINMIAQLQAELTRDNTEIEALNHEADEQEKKATEKANIYKMACESRKTSITGDIAKINTYIK
jgi:hypothetical protein